MKEHRFIKNTLYLYGVRFCTYIFPLLTMPYITRVLGSEQYGAYAWGNAIAIYIRMIVDFGFVLKGVELVARHEKQRETVAKIVCSVLICKTVILLLTIIGVFVLSEFNNKILDNRNMIFIFLIPVIISIFNIDYVFQGIEKMQYITYRTFITKAIFTVLIFVIVKKPKNMILIPVITAVGDLIVTVYSWYIYFEKEHFTLCIDRIQNVKEIFTQSIPFFISRCSGAVWSSGGVIALGFVSSNWEVAQFNLAFSLICVVQNMITPLSESAYPYLIKTKNLNVIKRCIIIFEPCMMIGCLITWVFGRNIVTGIFGTEYQFAAFLFQIMIVISMITVISCLIGFPLFAMYGKVEYANYATIYAAFIYLILMCVLAVNGSLNGMTLSILTVLVELIILLARIFYMKKIL